VFQSLWSFQGARGTRPPNRKNRPQSRRSFKTQQRRNVEVDVILGGP
jgi:hypothetical protein